MIVAAAVDAARFGGRSFVVMLQFSVATDPIIPLALLGALLLWEWSCVKSMLVGQRESQTRLPCSEEFGRALGCPGPSRRVSNAYPA
jgi:hypothetical protein